MDNVDVFCEKGVFELADTRRILAAATAKGLRANFHGEELSYLGLVIFRIYSPILGFSSPPNFFHALVLFSHLTPGRRRWGPSLAPGPSAILST